jgi:hypothetical protein
MSDRRFTPVVYNNDDLLNGRAGNDDLFVVTSEAYQDTDSKWVVEVHRDDAAAVNDKRAAQYNQPYTISDVRGGQVKDRWLLSGGTVIRDHEGRIAVGLRDGNAADPFHFTNIGAGRCDRKLKDHCLQEMVSEFILCIRGSGGRWAQVLLNAPERPPILNEIRANRQSIKRWKTREIPDAGILDISGTDVKQIRSSGPDTLIVNWTRTGEPPLVERLSGYVIKDTNNRTLEFRLAVAYNLSKYKPSDVEIFFAEGTGYAEWLTEDELKCLAKLDRVTPFLRELDKRLRRG